VVSYSFDDSVEGGKIYDILKVYAFELDHLTLDIGLPHHLRDVRPRHFELQLAANLTVLKKR
jgi:hypothetical protein